MGARPAIDPRGTSSRGVDHRVTSPRPPPPPQDYPPFSVLVLGAGGVSSVKDALAYALKWQIEFLALADPPDEHKQELADNLIRIWQYLVEQEVKSPLAPDATLLVDDLLKSFGRPRSKARAHEVAWNQSVPIVELEPEALDVWAPTLFPRDLPEEQRQQYPSRPKRLDEIPPFFPDMVRRWVQARAYRAPPAEAASARAGALARSPYGMTVVDDKLDPGPADEKAVKDALDRAERAMDRAELALAQTVAASGPTPNVNKVVGSLKQVTLRDIELQTQVEFPKAWGDRPLIEGTEIILYHGVYSFLLDKNGEPFDVNGRFDYPILVPEPGSQMKRHCPPPGGVFVSVQKVGFQNFRIEKGRIDKVLEGGVGGFEEYGYGYSGPHVYHQRIQQYLDSLGSHVFIAGITVPSANKREKITLGRIASRLPEFAEATIPPLVKEVQKRAQSKIDNWQEFLGQIATEVIRGIIVDEVKRRARNYLIKKIGVRIVPGLNAAAAIYDLASGGTERMRMRNAIACILTALESDADEDMTIAAKVCARIVADAFEDKIMAAIVNAGKAAARKAGKHVAIKVRGAGKPEGAQAKASEATDVKPSPSVAQGKASTPAKPAEAEAAGAPAKAAPGAKVAPSPDNLSLGAGGPPDHRAPVAKPAPKSPDEAAGRAVSEMKEKIYAELRRKAQEAFRLKAASGAPTPPADAAAGKKAARTAAAGTGDDGTRAPETGDDGVEGARANRARLGASAPSGQDAPAGAAGGGVGGSSGSGGGGGGGGAAGPPQSGGPGRRKRRSKEPDYAWVPDEAPSDDDDPTKPEWAHVGDEAKTRDATQDVRGPGQIRTSSHSGPQVGSANRDRMGEPVSPGHDPHHGAFKGSGGDTGDTMRKAISNNGVSIDDGTNITSARRTPTIAAPSGARGINDASRLTLDTTTPHSALHGEKQLGALSGWIDPTDDPDTIRSHLRDYANSRGEGRPIPDPEFRLDSKYEPDSKLMDDRDREAARRRRRRDPPPPPDDSDK